MSQLLLFSNPERFAEEIPHTDPEYVAGFSEGFASSREAEEPDRSRAFVAGWREGRAGCRVPEWRWAMHERGDG
jgi:hypothetical protein